MVGNRNCAPWFRWNTEKSPPGAIRAGFSASDLSLVTEGTSQRLAACLQQEMIMEKQGSRIVETTVEARGGFLGRPVLLVLVVSIALAAVLLAATYAGML
jgi:hypothetical protein